MKFSTAVLSTSLLATAAVAAPLTAQRQARNERRLAGRKSNPPSKPGTSEVVKLTGTSHEEYSGNWAGAVLIGSGYTGVSAQFTVPTPSAPSGGDDSTQYCASAWVGIDGDTCGSAILQTGVDFCIQGGTPSFSAWYEWFPDAAYNFDGFTISAGDVISISVDASSTSSGTATIENTSTGQSVNHNFDGGVQGTLCETNAEWIVEDFESGGSEVPFANFGTVTFSNAQATTGSGSVGPDGATIMDIKQGDSVLTSSSADSGSVTVQYQ